MWPGTFRMLILPKNVYIKVTVTVIVTVVLDFWPINSHLMKILIFSSFRKSHWSWNSSGLNKRTYVSIYLSRKSTGHSQRQCCSSGTYLLCWHWALKRWGPDPSGQSHWDSGGCHAEHSVYQFFRRQGSRHTLLQHQSLLADACMLLTFAVGTKASKNGWDGVLEGRPGRVDSLLGCVTWTDFLGFI